MPPDTHESDRLFAEIGRVTVRWAELEDALADFIASLLDDEWRYTRVIATELSYQGLTNLLVSLYIERHGDDSDLASLRQLLARADAVEQARNQIVHSTWISAGVSHVVTRVKSTAKRKHGYSTVVEKYDLDRFAQFQTKSPTSDRIWLDSLYRSSKRAKPLTCKMGANNRLMAAPNG